MLKTESVSYQHSLTVDYMVNLSDMVSQAGIDMEGLFKKADVDFATLATPGYRFPVHELNRLYEAAKQALHQPLLSLAIGQFVRPRSFPVIGYAAMCSKTLGDAIVQLQRFEPLVWDFGRSELHKGDLEDRLEWIPVSPGISPYLVEIAIAGWIFFGKDVLHSAPDIVHVVSFSHSPAVDVEEYEAAFGLPVKFGQSFNGLVLDKSALSQPLADADPGMKKLVQEVGNKQLSQYSVELNIVNSVCELILTYILEEFSEPSLELIASRLKLSGKQLSRRLADHQQSFSKLLDRVRKELVREWMSSADLSLIELAFALGFSEQSAFTRAFKRWYGVTPIDYRKKLHRPG